MAPVARGSAAAQLWALLSFVAAELVLAFIEALRLLVPLYVRPGSSRRQSSAASDDVTFYEGQVVHKRGKPVLHSFHHYVRYVLVELGPEPRQQSEFAQAQLAGHMSLAECRAMTQCRGRVRLHLLPKSAGYEQNPICVHAQPKQPPPTYYAAVSSRCSAARTCEYTDFCCVTQLRSSDPLTL